MRVRAASAFEFDAIAIEGGLLPAEWLAKVAALEAPQQTGADYGVPKGLNLRDELGRYWRIAEAHWGEFTAARRGAQDLNALSKRFVTRLLRDVFGVQDFVPATEPLLQEERAYPLSGLAVSGRLPVVIAAADRRLDERDRAFGDGGRQRSAFGLLQDFLNASDEALWGIVSNGISLRLARDNASLTRPAWIEADLERIFTEQRFSDFSLLWLLIHVSRFGAPGQPPHHCALEAWREASKEEGVRAREALRIGVEQALLELGQGFLTEPRNEALRQRLAGGELTPVDYFRELLRLVYRLIFLLTIEERGLLHPPDAAPDAIELYRGGYSLQRLREKARRRRAYDRHSDLWESLKPVFAGLADGQPLLALPALGGLFAQDQCKHLDAASLGNRALLAAVQHLAWMPSDGSLVRINWRDMGPEELGSVYESLLELVPQIAHDGRSFRFADAEQSRGNARKTSGSYYTPDELVQELLDSALEPVIAERVQGARDPEAALLGITVCDPACGSGHFLLAAARRLAAHLAKLRAEGTPSGDDFRHALRDVISHCIYGVDVNPMALELARMSLWLEAMTPDRPLSFLDHHLHCGDALLGVLDPAILDHGLPDEAYTPLTGDDKAVAAALRRQNKAERESWQRALSVADLFQVEHLGTISAEIDALADDDPDLVATKRRAWRETEARVHESRLARLADLYVGAFLLPKTKATESVLPTSRHLWAVANDDVQERLQAVEEAARAACAVARVMHWWVAFPQIAAQGGFAVMLGNPPWEVSQLSEEEFFLAKAPEIAERAGAHRKRAITELRHTDARLWQEYEEAKRAFDASNHFVRASRRYRLTAGGKINTYRLFAELFLQAIVSFGRAGFIVPSGIGTDDTSKSYFQEITRSGRLRSFVGFDNAKRIFPAVHPDTPFALVTIGPSGAEAQLSHYILTMDDLRDERRTFRLRPQEFSLINPNTRTCPVFRSQRDAELTKKLYGGAPVLIREAEKDADGAILQPEVNLWGIRFSQGLFNMTSDSQLFINPAPPLLPLYEAKLIHHFDHRWATYEPAADVEPAKWRSRYCTLDEHADPSFTPRARYFVNEMEVLARIALVPQVVRRAWISCHQASDSHALGCARAELWLGLAQWVAGELCRREAGPPLATGYTGARQLKVATAVEKALAARYPACARALKEAKVGSRKLATESAKWAVRDSNAALDDEELAILARFARQGASDERDAALRSELDDWMDRRSPRWLMGWRDITNATNERTVIASVIPRAGVGNNLPLMLFPPDSNTRQLSALLGNLCSLTLDFVARHKVGGTHLNYFIYKQLPVLAPDAYSDADLGFIAPRVLELTYTAHDLASWASEFEHNGGPFAWDPDRRAILRAELDAYYARLYGLTRDELRYILDPSDVMGDDYPSETFRVLKNNELSRFGEYRTRRLVLEAWDALPDR